jgi:hypothetical protein
MKRIFRRTEHTALESDGRCGLRSLSAALIALPAPTFTRGWAIQAVDGDLNEAAREAGRYACHVPADERVQYSRNHVAEMSWKYRTLSQVPQLRRR